ncbi:hypothetical protein OESDEN_07699 [Oesophagostomum dentatum]|uniref:Uncharacterized protein n=1 Tax=Oesophagostomum dentatum TaxID=61180 RepID=A0A0B1T4A3_OESDE|nr:hypothetical protein OESDEN_07699 [Oesophagostomum dentatum]
MLRRLGGSSNTLWRPKNPHSLEYLKYLHGVLVKNEKVVESNRKVLVEALRAIAEILIWGDQNDSKVFDFFLERQMLSYFLQIMKQDGGSLNVQLLQTLNILFENIRHETSLYFLLSNNHVNSIITHNFDFNNEEIMAYYISFMKTLSFKLNPSTIHFFFNEATDEFPLLTESLKFFDSSESMVRIAVRNIVLNIVKVDDAAMSKFVKGATKAYLYDLVDSLVAQAIELDTFVRSAENVIANRERLRDKVDDLVDLLHYIGELLEDTQISGDPSDSKSLHIVVEGQPTRQRKRQALLTARFVFDDHIRCMAAKQRLTKGRQTARGLKLQAICDLLGVPRIGSSSPRANPFRIVKGCAPGSVRKQFGFPIMMPRSAQGSTNSIPDDPQPHSTSSSSSTGAVKHV